MFSEYYPFWIPLPSFYAAVQQKYWNVKSFGYWKLKKIPCFLMALPAVLIVFYGCYRELRRLARYSR